MNEEAISKGGSISDNITLASQQIRNHCKIFVIVKVAYYLKYILEN